MRKNGSRLISLRQYCLTDLFLFAVILVVFELILHYALIAYHGSFTFSPLVPIVLLVMMRWGWPSVFYALGDGLLFCLLNRNVEGFQPYHYGVYIIGNAFIMLLLLMTRFVGKERIAKKWYFSTLFVVAGWVAVLFGRAVVSACFLHSFVGALLDGLGDCFSLAIGIVIILVMRKLDGMFEDQKHFLKRLDNERKEKMRRDNFGDDPVEIDEESISILNKKDDDLY
ncbi:MAG: hypothetical protein K2K60_00450 [Clostridia bacterium]|nr:hypothetical protein [Clostridia bacterium]